MWATQAHAAEALPAFETFAGKSVESEAVRAFIASREDLECVMTIACPGGTRSTYVFRDLGVELACDGKQIVSIVRYHGEGCPGFAAFAGDLPCGLSFSMTRRDVEAIIGRGKVLSPAGADRLWIEYPSRRLVVVYDTADRRDRAARMREVHLRAKP